MLKGKVGGRIFELFPSSEAELITKSLKLVAILKQSFSVDLLFLFISSIVVCLVSLPESWLVHFHGILLFPFAWFITSRKEFALDFLKRFVTLFLMLLKTNPSVCNPDLRDWSKNSKQCNAVGKKTLKAFKVPIFTHYISISVLKWQQWQCILWYFLCDIWNYWPS